MTYELDGPLEDFQPHDLQEFLTALRRTTRKVRVGDFTNNLCQLVPKFAEHWDKLKDLDVIGYLRARTLSAEILDYFGDYDGAEDVIIKEGLGAVRLLRKATSPADNQERLVLRQRCWVALMYSNTLYRRQAYADAELVLRSIQEVAERYLLATETPAWGLLARLRYSLGQNYRAQGRYEEAEESFSHSLEANDERLRLKVEKLQSGERRTGDPSPANELEYERNVASYFAAKCLGFGFGWIYYSQGYLGRARPFLMSARTLFRSTPDPIHKAQLNLLIGNVERTKLGRSDQKKLEQIIETLKSVRQEFENAQHLPYLARSNYALAVAVHYSDNREMPDNEQREQCRLCAQKVIEIAERIASPFWSCKGLVIQSRILRLEQKLEEAGQSADQARSLAEKFDLLSCKIQALIAQGEARFEMNEYQAAQQLFEEALQSSNSKKTKAVCHLHLARTALIQGFTESAKGHWAEWEKIKGFIENWMIQERLAKRVEEEFRKREKSFEISPEVKNLNVEEHVRRLREFLIARAEELYTTEQDRAKELGVSRQTLHQWKKSSQESGNSS